MDRPLMNLAQLSERTGVAYWRIAYAHRIGAIPPAGRLGHLRVYTAEQAEAVRAYFAERDREAHAPRRREAAGRA